ncbi:hybrid sensor histidine kinase/response regulator [Leptospira ryugenii]|uniref:hybrid sensor histidine kinase/response regulator n=1 Tax=Leptospira ryugenii TaxID=1917863 RepID=UPI001AE98790|nr:ATP-binding protein [Leptospira ryugenii]
MNPNEVDPKEKFLVQAGTHWTSLKKEGKPLPSFGYATYRLNVLLPDNRETLALSIPVLHTAYRLYVDGELVYENGIVSEYENIHKPSFHTKVIALRGVRKHLRLQIDISNYSHKIAGMKEVIHLGRIDNIYSEVSDVYVANWIIILFLSLLSLYHFFLYILRNSERGSFYLGFLYLGILVMILSLAEGRILFNTFSDSYWLLLVRLSNIGLPISIYMATRVLFHVFLNHKYEILIKVTKLYVILYILTTLFSPKAQMAEWTYLFEFWSIGFIALGLILTVIAVIQRKKDSLLYLFSLVLISLGSIYDTLYNGNYVSGFQGFGYYNLLFFLVPQTYILTRSIFQIFKSEEIASRQLMKSNEDLENKVKERTLELQKANRWKANFVSLMSHDLRSPLIGVSQILDVLQFKFSTTSDEEKLKFLNMSKEGIQNSLRMLKSLLDISRFDSEGIKLQQSQFDLKTLLQDVVSILDPIATVKEITLILNVQSETSIIADRALLEEVFKNIITNAIKFSYPHSQIEIAERMKGDWISIEIKDSGIGMDEDAIAKIFGEDNPKSQPGTNGELGSGFGLKLCLNILEAHFAKLKIHSEPGKGSTFEIQFSKNLRSVLLVDDSDAYRSSLAEDLRRRKWIVIEARNGEEALDHLSRIKPSLIITDKEMPIMDGISFLHEWEAIRGTHFIPVVFISSDLALSGGENLIESEGLDEIVMMSISKLVPISKMADRITKTFR